VRGGGHGDAPKKIPASGRRVGWPELFRACAQRFGWPPEVVLELTPDQAAMLLGAITADDPKTVMLSPAEYRRLFG